MKTLAELKRDAKNKNMSLELVERFGKTGYNYFRGIDNNNKMIDLYNIKYTKGD